MEDFTVGRGDHGEVMFPGRTSVGGLNLDELGT